MLPKITLVSGPAQLRQWIVQPRLSAREVTAQSTFCELSQLGYLLWFNVYLAVGNNEFSFQIMVFVCMFQHKLIFLYSIFFYHHFLESSRKKNILNSSRHSSFFNNFQKTILTAFNFFWWLLFGPEGNVRCRVCHE